MFLSKRSNGIYYLWFTAEGGKRDKVSTGCRVKSDAIKFLRDFKGKEVRKREEVRNKTLTTFFCEYSSYSGTNHTLKTQKSISSAFREFIRINGDVRLDSIGVRQIEAFLAIKTMEASPWTARKYYIHLASAWETARRWNYITDNPFRKVKKPKLRELQPLFFTKDEFEKLIHVISDEQYRNICCVGLLTGMRLGEILNLQWSDIDLDSKTLRVLNSSEFTTKSKRNRTLPISEQLYEILSVMGMKSSSALVFHKKGTRFDVDVISRKFKHYVRKARLRDKLHFHSLRHTFANGLVQDGVSLYEVQKLLGHSNISVTQVYSHLQPEKLHSTVNRISLPLNEGGMTSKRNC